jgi:hypothetical protein
MGSGNYIPGIGGTFLSIRAIRAVGGNKNPVESFFKRMQDPPGLYTA